MRSNQKPDTLMQDRIARIDESSCTARPDHTLGVKTRIRPFGYVSFHQLRSARIISGSGASMPSSLAAFRSMTNSKRCCAAS
jgi:hypothetical protein